MSDDVLVLWDIDGTLLNAGGVGRDLYKEVFLQLFGRPLASCAPMAGRTDRAIILETLTLAGIDEPRRHVDPFIASLGAHAQAVHDAVAERGQALPGAVEVLAALALARSLGTHRALGAVLADITDRGAAAGGGPEPGSAAPGGAVQTRTAVAAPPGGGTQTAVAQPAVAYAAVTSGPAAAAAAAAGPASAGPRSLAQLVPPQGGPAHMVAPHLAATQPAAPRAVTGTAGAGRPNRRVHQSVLTGSIRPVAEVKLAALGLRDGLDLCIGAYGDDHEDRTELVHVARRRAAGVHGQSAAEFTGTSTVVIGDTPLDVSAALAAGARAVGVASGLYSAADLRAAGAQTVLPDLTDTTAVLRALLG
jgi:phosphoglycolate phosphatase-like HAD superfamily hydrolase